MPCPIQIPIYFVAGDTVTFNVSEPDYPSPTWVLNWIVLSATPFQQAGVSDGNGGYVVTVIPATSATMTPGNYATAFVFTNGATGERRSVPGSVVNVMPNPTVPPVPGWAKATLAVVQAAITKLAATTNKEVIVNGQTYQKKDEKLLMDFRDRLRIEAEADEAAAGRPARGGAKTIVSRMTNN